MEHLITNFRLTVEQRILGWLDNLPPGEVNKAARYAVLGGGHRWRAMFALGISDLFTPNSEIFESVLSGAAAIELVHAASLVLDDLPSMDNALMRRGKPCAHLEFPPWAVDMLPVFLVTGAYNLFLGNHGIYSIRHLKAVQLLSRAGLKMINGQERDLVLSPRYKNVEDLVECYRLKTGALYSSAGKAIAVLCGADAADADMVAKCGMDFALYYQFLDDIGDVTGTVETIGKTAGMDKEKQTAVTMFGVEGSKKRARQYQQKALSHLNRYGKKADFLRYLIKKASYVLE